MNVGWRAIAVPGELHGLWTEYSKFGSGKVTWKSLVDPTIALMKEGKMRRERESRER